MSTDSQAFSLGIDRLSIPSDRLPNLLGIGAPKSGTTFFAKLIAQHPQVFVPQQKELNHMMYRDLCARHSEYLAHFTDSDTALYRCDFSVGYMSNALAASNARVLVPKAKIIVLLRNPVDQIVSHYWHLRRQNFHQPKFLVSPPSLLDAISLYPDRLLVPAYYGLCLEYWLSNFAKDQIFVDTFERLILEPQDVLKRFCNFLGVDYSPSIFDESIVTATQRRTGVQPKGGTSAVIYSWLYSRLAFGPYSWLKRRVGVRAADKLKRRLKVRETMEKLFFKTGYESVGEAERSILSGLLAEDRARLGGLGIFDPDVWD